MDFFNLNAINTDDEYFNLELLRKLSKSDIKMFYRLKLELELKGFNFGLTNGFFAYDVDYEDYEYLYTENVSSFSPFELQKLGLWEVISGLNRYEKSFYNYSPLERLVMYAKYQSNFKELLNNSGFKIISVTPVVEIQEEERVIDSDFRAIELEEDTNIFVSKKILQVMSMFRKISPELRLFLINNGIKTISDLLDINSIDLKKTLSKYNNQSDYTLNILTRSFDELKTYLSDIKRKYNLDETNLKKTLTNYEFAKQIYNNEKLNSEFVYLDKDILRKYDFDFINVVGLYEKEINLLVKLNMEKLTRIFNINEYTNIEYYCSKEYEFEDYYYDFYFLIEKIYGELNDCCDQHPVFAEKNLQSLYLFPSKEEYLTKIKVGYNKNTINILRQRDNGLTLQKVGSKYDVTRERIRQIQKKFVSDNQRYINSIIKKIILKFNYLPMEVLHSYPGFITTVADLNLLEFDSIVGVFISKNILNRINQQLEEWNPSKNLYEIVEEIRVKTKVDLLYSIVNIQKDKTIIPNKSLREVGEEYLLTKGILGWRIHEDTEEIIEFFSKYNKQIKGKRNIVSYITDNESAILYNLGKYIHKDNVDSRHIDAMKTVIANVTFSEYGNNAKDIFDENKSYLVENGILNYYYLYGLTREFYKEQKLVFTGRSMRIGLEETLDPAQNIIVSYLKENNNIANIKTLKSKLSIDDVTIQQSKSIYKLDANTIVTEDFFSINDLEEEKIIETIEKYTSLQGYCHTQNIIDDLYFDVEVNSFFKRNKIGKNQSRLIYTLNYYFDDLYSFSVRNTVVVPLGIEVRSYNDLLELHFKDKTFTMEDLKERFNYLKIRSSITQSNIINNNIIKLDKDQYVFKSDFNIDSINVSILYDIMNRYFSNETIVFSKEIIRRLKENELLEELWNKEELLATLINQSELPWQKVTVNVFTNAFSNSEVMLYNNSGLNREIMIGEVLIDFVYEKNKGYLTVDDINQILLDYEIITSKVPNGILYDIFSEYNTGGLIRVTKNES
jgi:hypothetical protein